MASDLSLFDRLGGYSTLRRVHTVFYDKIYAHPWIGQFFKGIDQKIIESQQTDFMAQAMGGPEKYSGAFPARAHTHMNVTPELFALRTRLLFESLKECGVSAELSEKWLKIDGAFRGVIVKSSVDECEKRYTNDHILDFLDPSGGST